MLKKIEFRGIIEIDTSYKEAPRSSVAYRRRFVEIPQKEVEKIVWCQERAKVKVVIEPVKKDNKSLFWFIAKKIEEWARFLKGTKK